MISTNKKIKNATPYSYNNINFRSKTEHHVYKILLEAGLKVSYEPCKKILLEGFKPTKPFYTKDSNNNLYLSTDKVRSITYTPDFVVNHDNYTIYIEVKGFKNDTYPIKSKMFRHYLESIPNTAFIEIYSVKQAKQAIEIIKKLCMNP